MKAIQIAFDENFEKKCRFASEGGFKYIAVNLHDMPDNSDEAYDKAPEQILEILNRYGLKAPQTHLYYYHPFLSIEKTEPELERRIMREIEVSGKIGAQWCVWHPRLYNTDGYNEELTLEYNNKSILKYLEQAERFGTGIAIENLFLDMCCSDYKLLCRLHDSFSQKNVGICWDFGHAHLTGFDQAEAIRYLGKRIKCTHIHNNYGKGNDFHNPPDNGTIDWEKVMTAVKDIEYTGPLTLETHCLYPQDDGLLRDFARYNFNCLEFLQRIMNK